MRTSKDHTGAELLQEGVSSHLQGGRAGEAATEGDVAGYHSVETRHGTACGNRREERGCEPPVGLGSALPHSSWGFSSQRREAPA